MNTVIHPENHLSSLFTDTSLSWQGPVQTAATQPAEMQAALRRADQIIFVFTDQGRLAMSDQGRLVSGSDYPLLAVLPAIPAQSLGSQRFKETYGTQYALYGGAMANAISSEDMVIEMGRAGMMASFGAGGLLPARIDEAIIKIKSALPNGPYLFNLLNSPFEPLMEQRAVDLYLQHGIRAIEASAYLGMTRGLVRYRASGLSLDQQGGVVIGNRIIAKVSRKEVARHFLSPAPEDMLRKLVEDGEISEQQAQLARRVPVADDITVEADSGGHTDNRPLVALLPVMLAYRASLQEKYHYAEPVRIGAGGGISTPAAALAAFMMGADYLVTGSINQACVESGASDEVRAMLAQAEMTDVIMAPASDMFEMGVKVQVLKRGTLFPMRAGKLYELYSRYNSIDDLPASERENLETKIFQRSLEEVWVETVAFFKERDPRQIEKAAQDAHYKMALIFRWYLGLSSRWAARAEASRKMDYQVWCGPSMGAFNDWARGTRFEAIENRKVVDVNRTLLEECTYLSRVQMLRMQGIEVPFS